MCDRQFKLMVINVCAELEKRVEDLSDTFNRKKI